MRANNYKYKNIEITICKYCGSFFKRRTKKMSGRVNSSKIRGKGYVTCSPECAKHWSRLLCNSVERQRKEEEWKRRMEVLKKEGVIS